MIQHIISDICLLNIYYLQNLVNDQKDEQVENIQD